MVVYAENLVKALCKVSEIVGGQKHDLAFVRSDCRTSTMPSWAPTSYAAERLVQKDDAGFLGHARAMKTL